MGWKVTAGVNPFLRCPVVDNAALIDIVWLSTQPAGVLNRGIVGPIELRFIVFISFSSNPSFLAKNIV